MSVDPEAGSAAQKLDRLRALLREMFQLDRGDLDFGLYRIMNLKSAEIVSFLDNELLPQVLESLQLTSDAERSDLERELDLARRGARRAGYDPDTAPSDAIIELNRRLAEMQRDAAAEADVYNHLANFFGRYYSEGDFISQRRYSSGGRSAYLIPYDGEDVKLHWANAGQYYIKTTANYASYVFKVGSDEAARRVRFEIAAADNEKDNVKEADGRQRRFVLAPGKGAAEVDGVDLIVRFEHRPLTDREKKQWPGNGGAQQGRINEAAIARILRSVDADWYVLLAAPAPTDADPDRTLLVRHVDRYTAKNSFDYFIHKDLGGFLRRELDLFLNTDVLNLDDLERGDAARLDRALARVRATRHVGRKIIDFLAQLEDFQKGLWLKKKFVLETNWCVTLDRVPEALCPEITANAAQCREWVDLFAADEIAGDLTNGNTAWTEPPTVDFLKANPYLVVDTRHFDGDFTDHLLAALSDAGPLDEQMDGLLVHGENFQALNLLQARYREQIKCVYIDPPYNTDASAILYKNNYKDSSWLSLMHDRVSLAREFLKNDGVLCVAIDDEEMPPLRMVLARLFERRLGIVSVRSNPAGRKSRGQLSPAHEYALFFGNIVAVPGTLDKTDAQLARYPLVDDQGRYAWNNLIRHGSGDRRQDRPTMFYPIYVSDADALRVPEMEWDPGKREYRVLVEPGADETAVWPVSMEEGRVVEKRWHRGPDRVAGGSSDHRVRRGKRNENDNEIKIDFKIRADENSMPRTWWDDTRYASANLGPKVLKELFGEQEFDFAKAVGLVEDCLRASACDSAAIALDFFAGSGTTGHAVVSLNRADSGNRRYVLVEMGQHFDTVILPRMKKVVHSSDWKGGRPVSRDGVSHVFKYVRLESYEDTMDSLEAVPRSDEQEALLNANAELAEDYRLRYALGAETAGSACLLGKGFMDPLAYVLSALRDGVRRDVGVDLPETFNYLIGLHVESRHRIDGVLAITGSDPQGRRCLILWRNLGETDHAALDAWFERNRRRFAALLDRVYVNGDHTLTAMRRPDETWTAIQIEPVFRESMFERNQ